MKTYTLLNLNVERDYHIDKIRNLIKETQPDIICLQEVFNSTITQLREEFPHYISAPRLFINKDGHTYSDGVVVMSKHPIIDTKILSYGNNKEIPTYENEDVFHFKNNMRPMESFNFNYSIACITININDIPVTIGTTHFPAAEKASRGRFDNVFEKDAEFNYYLGVREIYSSFIKTIKSIASPFIFTADTNNDRNDYMYQQLSCELIDQVPQDLTSSIDPDLHKVKGLTLMVDTIMTTPEIKIDKFNVIQGVSDHKAFLINFYV